jgi:hypothetical protein
MGARYYDAELARFASADTTVPDPSSPQALNRYSYVYNDPLSYTDPTGHEPHYAIPEVSPPSTALYVSQGFAYTQYQAAINELVDANNSVWARGTALALATAVTPLALTEEYIYRPLVNTPNTVTNAGTSIGEHSARGLDTDAERFQGSLRRARHGLHERHNEGVRQDLPRHGSRRRGRDRRCGCDRLPARVTSRCSPRLRAGPCMGLRAVHRVRRASFFRGQLRQLSRRLES